MNKVFMLATANIKRGKSAAIGVFALLLIAAMLLNIGIAMLDVNNFFDARMAEMDAPHIVFAQPYHLAGNPYVVFLQDHPAVARVTYHPALRNMGSVRDHNDNPFVGTEIFISPHYELAGNQAKLPLGTALLAGHQAGDDFGVDFGVNTLPFTLVHTFEHHLLDNPNAFPRGFYTAPDYFNTLWQHPDHGDSQYYLIYATLYEEAMIHRVTTDMVMAFEGNLFHYNMHSARESRTMIPSVIAIFLSLFSVILMVVSIVVIRFRIINSIEEGMKNIGVLKALGFKSSAIIWAYVLQFALIALVAAMVGAGLSTVATPFLTSISEPMLGLHWEVGFDMILAICSVGAVVGITVIFVCISALRIRPLYPITALRGGLQNHNFTKNHLGLHKRYAPLNLQLALKSLLQNKRQAIAMVVISTVLTFSAAFGTIMLYNMQVNSHAFIVMAAGEIVAGSDAVLVIREDNDQMRTQIENHPQVMALQRFDFLSVLVVNDILTRVAIFEDPALFSADFLTAGRLPVYDNEILINRASAIEFDAYVGSWLTIDDMQFLVTGIGRDMDGMFTPAVVFNLLGGLTVLPDFQFTAYGIDMVAGSPVSALYQYVHSHFGDLVMAVWSIEIQGDMIMEAIAPPFVAVSGIIMVAVFAVIIMVLYLIIKTTILRRKKDLGIQKAMGFTSFMLMKQIALNLTPTIILGAVCGIMLGFVFINPLLGQLLIGIGIEPGNMFLPTAYMLGAAGAVVVLSYVVSLLVAGRIRGISAYEMVTE